MHVERRRHTRYPFACNIIGVSSAPRVEGSRAHLFQGTIVDVSSSGVSAVWDRAPERFAVLSCRLHFPDVPIGVPVLAQVRWVEPIDGSSYRLGLTFIA
jgi:hypothetical protein